MTTKKIVVIDDEPDVRDMMRAILATRGHQVFLAGSGDEGLAVAAKENVDLMICDLMMPRVSGLEVLKRMKKDPVLCKIPIIIISALGDEARPPAFWIKTLGVDDYLQKPFDPLDLLGRVEYIFRRGNYVSARPGTPTPDDPVFAPAQNAAPADIKLARPQDVVRAYVSAWNTQDFNAEFQCMGEEMLGSLTLRDYIERRQRAYIDEQERPHTQQVSNVEEEKISLNVAKVAIEREDATEDTAVKRREVYSLKKTHQGWKIIACRVAKKI
ncbi:hypothetical protein BH09SUM1_BH09SUM1_14410 [soil metagenome]